jgi:hypothetical protein
MDEGNTIIEQEQYLKLWMMPRSWALMVASRYDGSSPGFALTCMTGGHSKRALVGH